MAQACIDASIFAVTSAGIGAAAMGLAAALPIAAGWFGAAIGRTFSMLLDRGKGGEAKIIPIWMATEIALGLAIAAPILQFTG